MAVGQNMKEGASNILPQVVFRELVGRPEPQDRFPTVSVTVSALWVVCVPQPQVG